MLSELEKKSMFVNLTFSVSRITRTLPYSKIHFGKYNEWQEGLGKLTNIRNKSIGVAAVKRHSYFPGFEKTTGCKQTGNNRPKS